MADRLDRINRENYLRGNLIKWWNVNVIPAEMADESAEDMEEAMFEDVEKHAEDSDYILDVNDANEEIQDSGSLGEEEFRTYEKVMQSNSNDSAYEKALKELQLSEAKEIYERLLKEAEEDERKKQEEIEAARAQN